MNAGLPEGKGVRNFNWKGIYTERGERLDISKDDPRPRSSEGGKRPGNMKYGKGKRF